MDDKRIQQRELSNLGCGGSRRFECIGRRDRHCLGASYKRLRRRLVEVAVTRRSPPSRPTAPATNTISNYIAGSRRCNYFAVIDRQRASLSLAPDRCTSAPPTDEPHLGTARNGARHAPVTGRLHGPIVGPTGRSDWSVRPVG